MMNSDVTAVKLNETLPPSGKVVRGESLPFVNPFSPNSTTSVHTDSLTKLTDIHTSTNAHTQQDISAYRHRERFSLPVPTLSTLAKAVQWILQSRSR